MTDVQRRAILVGSIATLLAGCAAPGRRRRAHDAPELERIRAEIGGRLGVHALDTSTGHRLGFDDTSRYAMCSTFKLPLAAAILESVETGVLTLDQRVTISPSDIVPHSPRTEPQLAQGFLTVADLTAAIIEVSDNTAANLLLGLIGGPAGLTAGLRAFGDETTRLDRYEIELNTNLPGDPRDTTTPRAMVDTMRRVLVDEDVLSKTSRDRLIAWLVASTTGLQRLRAGVPPEWRVGDKTGTGANGAANDIAIAWPPGRGPILMAVFTSESTRSIAALNAAHARVAGVIGRDYRGNGRSRTYDPSLRGPLRRACGRSGWTTRKGAACFPSARLPAAEGEPG
jgi:beta-lactamase class A